MLGKCLHLLFALAVAHANVHRIRTPNQAPALPKASLSQVEPYPVGITYHGGPVMTSPTPVHLLYYGNWTNEQQHLVETFIMDMPTMVDLKPSPGRWFDIERLYSSNGTPQGKFIEGPVLGKIAFDNYTKGLQLSQPDLWDIISSHIVSGQLPDQASALYFFLASADVSFPGFCVTFCGFHDQVISSNSFRSYGFVQNAQECGHPCGAGQVSPNGDVGIDALLSVLAHEVVEALSDPLPLSGWHDANGNENADKCVWTFGSTAIMDNGAIYNVEAVGISGRRYLIQRNWNPLTGECDTSAIIPKNLSIWITVCNPNPCGPGMCEPFSFDSDYVCNCPSGMYFSLEPKTCLRETLCNPNPCGAGTCQQMTATQYSCSCPQLIITNTTCPPMVNVCDPNPCGPGTCEPFPYDNSDYFCNCPSRMYFDLESKTCLRGTLCNPNPCGDGTCQQMTATQYSCSCPQLIITNTTCPPMVNVCDPNPCGPGTCEPFPYDNSDYFCNCPSRMYFDLESKTCLRGTLCNPNPCGDGTCQQMTATQYGCYCPQLIITNTTCPPIVNVCDPNPCGPATCEPLPFGKHICHCPSGMYFDNYLFICLWETLCNPNPCGDGTCQQMTPTEYMCYCSQGTMTDTTCPPRPDSTLAAPIDEVDANLHNGQPVFAMHTTELTPCQMAEMAGQSPGQFVPHCQLDGSYTPLQCSNTLCWCVDANGDEIAGTRMTPGTRILQCPGASPSPSV